MIRIRRVVSLFAVLVVALTADAAVAQVRVASVFGDHMVLQRRVKLPVWGWAKAGEKVTVALGDAKAEATADEAGQWRVEMAAMEAGGPHTITVTGADGKTATISDVLIGEVWLCSGQSNMEWTVRQCRDAKREIAAGDHPRIRHFKAPNLASATPRDNVAGRWVVSTPTTVGDFTACGYYMARELEKQLDVPIGLIGSNWGGTRIEPWTPPAGFDGVASLKGIADAAAARAATATADQKVNHQDPVMLYNGMIHGIVGFPIRGAIWYQGESNNGEGMLYADKMRALIEGWRKVWGIGEFPFYFVQIAPFNYGDQPPHVLAELWEAQAAAARDVPNSGMVVINDIATLNDIHPPNKQDVGLRLANMALKRTYGKSGVVDSGPAFKSLATKGDALRVTFENTAGGLKWRGGKSGPYFEIIGPGSGWQTAEARIEVDTVVLTHEKVKAPAAVRFAWHKLAEPNLVNGAGLPTGAFRAGEVPRPDALPHVEEAKGYTLVLDADLKKLRPTVGYDADHRGAIKGPFDRVGYLVELESEGGKANWVWVSTDAFTDDAGKIGIPTAASGATFAVKVTGMNVASNVAGIETGNGLDGGNIEFWPNNYAPANKAQVPDASGEVYDFGDAPADPREGYGSMQVHNHKAKQTLFAINHWSAAGQADLGIGNSEGKTRDWTFAGNVGSYSSARLRVFVRIR